MALLTQNKVWLVMEVVPDPDNPDEVMMGDVRSVWASHSAAIAEAEEVRKIGPCAVMEHEVRGRVLLI